MPIEKWAQNVIIARLGDDPQMADDLEALETLAGQGRISAVLDFGSVRFVNSSNIANLLKLRRQITATDGRLVLCGVDTRIWGTFLVTGLDKLFEFSDSVSTSLATLQMV